MLLITTNEPVGRLHPATRRPGRCVADIEFTPLAPEEANAWLAAHGHTRRVDRPTPLAELFGEDGRPAGRGGVGRAGVRVRPGAVRGRTLTDRLDRATSWSSTL